MALDENTKTVFDDLNFVTDRLSTLTRQVSFGVIAVSWAALSGDPTKTQVHISSRGLLLATGLSIAALLCDLFQYVAAYVSSKHALRAARAGSQSPYDHHSPSYRVRVTLFGVKIAIAGGAAFALLVLITQALL